MAGSILGDIGTRSTPQSERTPGRTDEVKNSAGGYVHALDKWDRLERFLILGVDAGTYYVKARALAIDNAEVVDACLDEDFVRTINTAVSVSLDGRAPNNDPALFVLAVAASHSNVAVRAMALGQLAHVARIGTHLFHFVRFAQSRRGWGRSLTRAVGAWYADKDATKIAYDVVKYRQRDGWSHRDVLRKAHPAAPTKAHRAVYDFVCGRTPEADVPRILEGFAKIQATTDAKAAADLVREYTLPWETVPSALLAGDEVWRALIETPNALPLGALLRNLGVLTNRGIITAGTMEAATVAGRLTDGDAIRKARIHPVGVLNALVTYKGGVSRGGVGWTSNPVIIDALDDAFYLAFGNVEATNKRTMLAIDCSASMTWQPCVGAAFDCRQGAAAMAMVTDAVERDTTIVGFCGDLLPLDLSSKRRLDDNVAEVGRQRAGRTDCSQPMLHAIDAGLSIDTFVVYTDNETWAGSMKPVQALRKYREKSSIDARLVVVGMTSTGFTIADPADSGMLDVVGFDASAPQVISGFAAR